MVTGRSWDVIACNCKCVRETVAAVAVAVVVVVGVMVVVEVVVVAVAAAAVHVISTIFVSRRTSFLGTDIFYDKSERYNLRV